MLGHLLVHFSDQRVVHTMIKVNLNITVFIIAHFLGVFKKSQTVPKPLGCEKLWDKLFEVTFLFLSSMKFFQMYLSVVN